MARKPVHLTAAHGKASRPGRQGIWEAIRSLRTFTVADLESHCHTKQATIRTYVMGLERSGYLQRVGNAEKDPRFSRANSFQALVYELIRDVGIEAPRVTRDGKPVTQGASREQMWRTAKILGTFNATELSVHASTEENVVRLEDAKSYVRYLALAGYLITVDKGGPGQQARYRFLPSRNSGPEAPQVQRVKQVWDPNLGEVVWTPGGEQ